MSKLGKKPILIPKDTKILEGNINPTLKIELKGAEDEVI